VDSTGAALATSVGPQGNIGCPVTDEEISFFTSQLKKTTKMTDAELAEVAKEFKNP
jgi:hypothetical protein